MGSGLDKIYTRFIIIYFWKAEWMNVELLFLKVVLLELEMFNVLSDSTIFVYDRSIALAHF